MKNLETHKINAANFTDEGLAFNASGFSLHLWQRARNSDAAKAMLKSLALQVVELAAARLQDDETFSDTATEFINSIRGKNPSTKSVFCNTWLTCGLLEEGGLDSALSVEDPARVTSLAINALEIHFGANWEDSSEVLMEFGRKLHSTNEGPRKWSQMKKGQKREVVRKALRSAARTWKRQA